jgi:hypothetical protein
MAATSRSWDRLRVLPAIAVNGSGRWIPSAESAWRRVPLSAAAIGAFLSTLERPETVGNRRVYAATRSQLHAHLGDNAPIGLLDDPAPAPALAD